MRSEMIFKLHFIHEVKHFSTINSCTNNYLMLISQKLFEWPQTKLRNKLRHCQGDTASTFDTLDFYLLVQAFVLY